MKQLHSLIIRFSLFVLILIPVESFAQVCDVSGGSITTSGNSTFCSGDGLADIVNLEVTGNTGPNSRTILVLGHGEIAEIHESLSIDLEGRPTRTFLVYNIAYEAGLSGLVVGGNISNLSGCFSLSNTNVVLTINFVSAGNITTRNGLTDTTVCVDDGKADYLDLTITNAFGVGFVWAQTDLAGTITSLNFAPGDFEGTGAGPVRVHLILSCFDFFPEEIVVGMNINSLPSNAKASNAITVTKNTNCPPTCLPENKACPGNKVLMCVNNVSTCVPQKQVDKLLRQGATMGGCIICPVIQPPVSKGISVNPPNQKSFSVYPNPSHGPLWIASPDKDPVVEIRTMTGQLLWTKKIYNPYTHVSMEGLILKQGVYFITLKTTTKKETQRVVVIE